MGVIFDIRRGGVKDGPGIRTSVFLKGCPLRCVWCHNPESQNAFPQRTVTGGVLCGYETTAEEVLREVRRDSVFYARSGGGLTITGGEPMMQPEFSYELAAAAKREGIRVAIDTCGFAPWEAFERMLPVVDLFLYDLKCMNPERHRRLTGVDNALILGNLRKLDAAGARTWIRCPLVPGLNDADEDLRALAAFVKGLRNAERTDVCPYHPIGLEKYRNFGIPVRYGGTEEPTATQIRRWRRIIFNEGQKRKEGT